MSLMMNMESYFMPIGFVNQLRKGEIPEIKPDSFSLTPTTGREIVTVMFHYEEERVNDLQVRTVPGMEPIVAETVQDEDFYHEEAMIGHAESIQ